MCHCSIVHLTFSQIRNCQDDIDLHNNDRGVQRMYSAVSHTRCRNDIQYTIERIAIIETISTQEDKFKFLKEKQS